MGKFVIIILCLLLSNLTAIDEIWQKTEKLVENSKYLVPGVSVEAMNIQASHKGEKADFEMVFIIKHSYCKESEKIINTFDDAYINVVGQDTAEDYDMTELIEYFKEKSPSLNRDLNQKLTNKGLFTDKNAKYREIIRKPGIHKYNDKDCYIYQAKYSPSGKKKDIHNFEIYIDAKNSSPLFADIKPQRKTIGLKEFVNNMYFDYDEESQRFMITKDYNHMVISFLFFTAPTTYSIEYKDYWDIREFSTKF